MATAVFSVFAAMLALFPFFTPYLVRLGADAPFAGGVVAAYSLANLLGNGLGGWLADRLGRRLPLLVGLGVSALSMLAYLVPVLLVVAGAHALHGLAAGMVVPAAFAWVGDRSLLTGRGRAMGRAGAAIGAAAVVAPPLGGALAQRAGEAAVFGLLALLLAGAFAHVARGTAGRAADRPLGGGRGRQPPATAEAADRLRPGWVPGRRPGAPAAPLLTAPLLRAYGAGFALQLGFGMMIWLLPLQAQGAGFGPRVPGVLMGLVGAVAGLWMAAGGRLADRYGRGALAGGLLLMAAAQALLASLPESGREWVVRAAVATAAFGTGFGWMFPAAAALVSESAPAAQQGSAFALFYVAFSLGTMAAPAMGALLLELAGRGAPGAPGWAALPYLLGAGVLALASGACAYAPRSGWAYSRGRPAGR